MRLDNLVVFDMECNAVKNPDRLHCLSYAIRVDDEWKLHSTTDYNEMREFFTKGYTLVGHNIYRFDIPVFEDILGITIDNDKIDTLALSWYLYPELKKHGLEEWGEYFGIPKPKITDWENLSIEEYVYRCEEDVKNNCKLIDKQLKDLNTLYDGSESSVIKLIKYLMFKMYCATLQEKSKWKLDVEKCTQYLEELTTLKEEKVTLLKQVMPKVAIKAEKNRPKRMYKQDGSLSSLGQKWVDLCESLGLPQEWEESIEYIRKWEEPNPNSTKQIKDWLYKLGWKPESFSYNREDDGSVRKIEQVRIDKNGERMICPSVKALFEREPGLKNLEDYTMLTHRIGLFKSYLKTVDEKGFVVAGMNGFTNTLRFKHVKPICNLVGVDKPYGEWIRGVLIASDDEHELCGSDMSSLEDKTKCHLMWKYDPDYVKEMSTPGYDPHLAIGVFANLMTQDDVDFFKKVKKELKKAGDEGRLDEYKEELGKEGYERYKKIGVGRSKAKATNYSGIYGIGAESLGRDLEISTSEAKGLLEAYWEKNWAVKKIAEDCTVKEALGGRWLLNPVSKVWHSLRHDKDRFSTANQSLGVYCFDLWLKEVLSRRPELTATYHDELVLNIKKGFRKECEQLLRDSIAKVNDIVKLNTTLDIDVQFGHAYSSIH